jgi:DNA-binding transcriptional MerR regulator
MLDKKVIVKALEKHWNIGPAAKELGVGYSTLRKYIKFHCIVHNSRGKKGGPTFDKNAHSSTKVTKARRIRKIESLE